MEILVNMDDDLFSELFANSSSQMRNWKMHRHENRASELQSNTLSKIRYALLNANKIMGSADEFVTISTIIVHKVLCPISKDVTITTKNEIWVH